MSTLKLLVLRIFPSPSTLESEIRNYVKYATSDFTGISKYSNIKKARLRLDFLKALGLKNAGEVLSLVFELLPEVLDNNY